MINRWLGNSVPLQKWSNVEDRSSDTARLIDAKPSWVRLMRPVEDYADVTAPPTLIELPAQKVRIEVIQSIRSAGEQRNTQVEVPKQYTIVIGLRDHPTQPNLDIRRGDRFFYQERTFECMEFIETIPGRLMVSCELTP